MKNADQKLNKTRQMCQDKPKIKAVILAQSLNKSGIQSVKTKTPKIFFFLILGILLCGSVKLWELFCSLLCFIKLSPLFDTPIFCKTTALAFSSSLLMAPPVTLFPSFNLKSSSRFLFTEFRFGRCKGIRIKSNFGSVICLASYIY